MPAISVLLPARDAAATIGETLASLAAQTLSDFEIVLVDDGSDDETVEVVRAAWGKDSRLRLLHPGRVGLVAALDVGLAACRAELIARMDADDLADPRRLELQAALLATHPEVAIAGCLVESFPRATLGGGYRTYEAWQNGLLGHDDIARAMYIESPLAHPSVMMRREAIVALGGYRDRGWPEDYDLWLRAARAGLRFAKVPVVLHHWRDGAGRLSRRDPRYSPDAFLACKAHHLCAGPLAGRGAVVLWGAGRGGRRVARALYRHGVEVAAFVDVDPRKIGRPRCGAPTVAPDALGALRDHFLLAAVGTRGARDEIRRYVAELGFREGEDFLCVA